MIVGLKETSFSVHTNLLDDHIHVPYMSVKWKGSEIPRNYLDFTGREQTVAFDQFQRNENDFSAFEASG